MNNNLNLSKNFEVLHLPVDITGDKPCENIIAPCLNLDNKRKEHKEIFERTAMKKNYLNTLQQQT